MEDADKDPGGKKIDLKSKMRQKVTRTYPY